MICSLLKLLAGCSLLHTYMISMDTNQTIGMNLQNSGVNITMFNNHSYAECFMGIKNRLIADIHLKTTETIVKNDRSVIVYNKNMKFEKIECDDDDEEDDEDCEDQEDEKPIVRVTRPPTVKPTPFNPDRREQLQDQIEELSLKMASGKVSNMKAIMRTAIKIRDLKRKIAKENVKEAIQKQRDFLKTEEGQEAIEFCKKTGVSGKALEGCVQDMRFTHNKTITRRSAELTSKALVFNKKVTIQSKNIIPVYTVKKKIEIDRVAKKIKMAENRVKEIGKKLKEEFIPSRKIELKKQLETSKKDVMTSRAILNKINPVKGIVNVVNAKNVRNTNVKKVQNVRKQKVVVVTKKSRVCTASGDPHFTNFNGDYFHLQEPSIFTFAKSKDGKFEVQVKQNGATRVGQPSYVRSTKIRYDGNIYTSSFSKDGFSVQQSGTTLVVAVPASYEGEMMGICGEDTPVQGVHNFRTPDGAIADVEYGQRGWEMGGYGGPNTKLSRWHLSWKPSLDQCMFSVNDCKANLGLPVPSIAKRRRG